MKRYEISNILAEASALRRTYFRARLAKLRRGHHALHAS